jgi:ribosomal protein L37AE/L43A
MNAPTTCPFCGSPVVHRPAGISKKSGNSYSEFWACSNRDCNYTWNPPKSQSDTPYQKVEATQNQIDLNDLNKNLANLTKNQVALSKLIKKVLEILQKDTEFSKKDFTFDKDEDEPEKFDDSNPFIDY